MGNFVVSARKYRPARFDEVVGQGHVVGTLKNALKTDHLAHAFLFCGPRGVGKTTCARILAKTINCENIGADTEACGECSSCKAMDENASFNIMEMDGASYNKVEHIREINEQVRILPQHGSYKVFIIDEVHMLSLSAFNAFLKTLEEPPPHAIFILATTEKHKIIPTILSRCQIFDFKRIQVADIADHLEEISSLEGIEAEREALVTIAQKVDGALRDALSIYDRIANAGSKQITYQDVVTNLNLLDYDTYFGIADACAREDMKDIFLRFDRVLKDGFEADVFVQGLAAHFRDLLMTKNNATLQLLEHSEALKSRYQNQSEIFSKAFLFNALNHLNECDINYPRSQNKRLLVEVTLAKICHLGRVSSVSAFPVDQVQTAEKKTVELSPSTPVEPEVSLVETAPHPEPQAEPVMPEKTDVSIPSIPKFTMPKPANGDTVAVLDTPTLPSLNQIGTMVVAAEKEAKENSLTFDLENLQQVWNTYLTEIDSPSVAVTLKQAQLKVEDDAIKIAVGTQQARARIIEEASLLETLRTTFHKPNLQMVFEIDPALDVNAEMKKPKKLLTNKEKYEHLCSKNPHMRDLKNSLDLIVDNEV